MRLFTFCHQILSILTIGANIGSCPRTTLPSPTAFSISRHFRALRPHAGLARLFLSFVVISIMAALKVLHEVTACIYKGEEKPVMKWSFLTKVENKDLKSFLQALNAFGVDQRAKELGIQDYKLKLQCKRLTPEPEFPRGRVFAIDSDEQFLTCLPLLQDKHELICKYLRVHSFSSVYL